MPRYFPAVPWSKLSSDRQTAADPERRRSRPSAKFGPELPAGKTSVSNSGKREFLLHGGGSCVIESRVRYAYSQWVEHFRSHSNATG